MASLINRTGEINYNKFGDKMIIANYNNYDDIIVEFLDRHHFQIHTAYSCFKNGSVTNPYDKSFYNIGYMGVGKYDSINNKNAYTKWINMLKRCYCEKTFKTNPTYKDCIVAEEWHNFQHFAEWLNNNYYEIENEVMCLDKDILVKGNKIYGSNTCCIVPQVINNLFTKSELTRGDLPIGVTKKRNKFSAQVYYKNKRIHIGTFDTPIKAFNAYKEKKEELIRQFANEYINQIPKKLYNTLCNYKVEITD